jgi:CheY-like chemotaxis protein
VRGLIESARWRKFTLKVGGQELTMEEINQQQRALIADLQTQVETIRINAMPNKGHEKEKIDAIPREFPSRRSVLWVDDNPKNNSYLVQMLRDKGLRIDLALSTEEGMQHFHSGNYGVIVSDMGRKESDRYHPDAGIELLKKVREQDPNIPFIIYCSAKKAREYRDHAIQYRVTDITSSPTEVTGVLLRQFEMAGA